MCSTLLYIIIRVKCAYVSLDEDGLFDNCDELCDRELLFPGLFFNITPDVNEEEIKTNEITTEEKKIHSTNKCRITTNDATNGKISIFRAL